MSEARLPHHIQEGRFHIEGIHLTGVVWLRLAFNSTDIKSTDIRALQ